MSLGNHEFDEAVAGVIPFINNLTTPVLAANLILDKVPELKEEDHLRKSTVITINGVKIGIIGYLTGDTKFLAPKNNVEYEDEIPALNREVKKLKQEGVNILIALGHSGFMKDLEIAKHVENLDLVIGGHSNTFLINKNSTDEIPEVPQGPYPTEIQQSSGRIVRVVQAYAYTKYLGKLHLVFDSNGEIIHCDGTPILLNQEIPRDPELLRMVNKYRHDIDIIYNEVVGSSMITLNGDNCRLRECNIGDLIADSMLDYTKNVGHSNINIAIIQGGRIRASIDRPEKPYKMTKGDWLTVLPFTDYLTIVTMNGKVLRQSLEHAVENWRTIDTPGQFLQFSGMSVVYDLAQPIGSRVVTAKAACSGCNTNELADIDESLEYKVIMSSFLADGGDGYAMFENLPKEILSYNEVETVLHYINQTDLVRQKENGRLILLNEDKVRNQPGIDINHDISSNGEFNRSSRLHFLFLTLALYLQF